MEKLKDTGWYHEILTKHCRIIPAIISLRGFLPSRKHWGQTNHVVTAAGYQSSLHSSLYPCFASARATSPRYAECFHMYRVVFIGCTLRLNLYRRQGDIHIPPWLRGTLILAGDFMTCAVSFDEISAQGQPRSLSTIVLICILKRGPFSYCF